MDVFETFKKIDGYRKTQLIRDQPTCFNGDVSVRKYKVTIALVDEPIEVIRERIQKMWDECDNSHHWEPLRKEAAKFGLSLAFESQRRNNGQ